MKAAGDRLKRAISSAVDPPPEVLEQFPLADTESITFLPLTYYNYTTEDQVGVGFHGGFFFIFFVAKIPKQFYIAHRKTPNWRFDQAPN